MELDDAPVARVTTHGWIFVTFPFSFHFEFISVGKCLPGLCLHVLMLLPNLIHDLSRRKLGDDDMCGLGSSEDSGNIGPSHSTAASDLSEFI